MQTLKQLTKQNIRAELFIPNVTNFTILPTRRNASAVLALAVRRLSVCLFVTIQC